jgi:hypothetical protein
VETLTNSGPTTASVVSTAWCSFFWGWALGGKAVGVRLGWYDILLGPEGTNRVFLVGSACSSVGGCGFLVGMVGLLLEGQSAPVHQTVSVWFGFLWGLGRVGVGGVVVVWGWLFFENCTVDASILF